LTPEEYEALLTSFEELKANAKVYSTGFALFTIGFSFWQRRFLPRPFFPFALGVGALSGAAYGSIKTGWYLVERVDALGKDYEISRIVKQDIFDTRPDLDGGIRAQYYMYQQK